MQPFYASVSHLQTKRVQPTSKLANIKNTIILFGYPSKVLHKHCFQFPKSQ